ncbi:hypothetical protein ACB316_12055 [Aeromonas sanarellii]
MKILDLYNSWGEDPAELGKTKNYIKLSVIIFVISIILKVSSFSQDRYDIDAARLLDIIISSASLLSIFSIVWFFISYHYRLNSQVSGEFLSVISASDEIPAGIKMVIARRVIASSNVITYRQIFSIEKNYVPENEGIKKIKKWDEKL